MFCDSMLKYHRLRAQSKIAYPIIKQVKGISCMKSIKSKIQISMLSVVLVGSVLIGVITALLNASGIDDVMTKTLGPATQMAADAVEWKMGNY